MEDAMAKNKDADVLVNFASLRSAYDSTIETLNFPQIRTIAIIAEGKIEIYVKKTSHPQNLKPTNTNVCWKFYSIS